MNDGPRCPLCHKVDAGCKDASYGSEWECRWCGAFGMSNGALSGLTDLDRVKISSCLAERKIHKRLPLILVADDEEDVPGNTMSVREVINSFPQRIQDQLNRTLINLNAQTEYPGDVIQVFSGEPLYDGHELSILYMAWVRAGFMAVSNGHAGLLLEQMQTLGYIKTHVQRIENKERLYEIRLGAAGIAKVEELENTQARQQSRQGFVAMWFNDDMANAYDEGFRLAIKNCGFKAMRIDNKETNEKVCDEIIAEIRRSRFVVADFTGHRGGVYFEAGYAKGLGIPVIWTCRKDDFDKLHFDTRQYGHIKWETPTDLYDKLIKRIAATIDGALYPMPQS